ncbi:MAG: flagellar motor switch protein FliM [Ignavibacteriaceae bacterium]
MAEVLSQQEIDQLLNKVKSGKEKEDDVIVKSSENEIIPFDFRLPNRISKNQLRTIRNINENFAESFSSFLVTKLQSMVVVKVTTVDQIYYSEYILSVPNPACLFTFEIKNSDIKGILEINTDLALTLVDRLLGGNGSSTKQSKLITPIEQKVLSAVVEKIMQDLKKAWQVVGSFEFGVERFEPDIDFAQITTQSESVLLISFEVMIGEEPFMMNICFATYAFDLILNKLSSQKLSSVRPMKYEGTTSEEILTDHLYNTFIPVTVEFGKGKITVQELMELQKGDIIELETGINDEHIIKIGNKILFYGRAGNLNKHKAIKVTNKIISENLNR